MHNHFDKLSQSMTQSVPRRGALKQFGIGLALFLALSVVVSAEDTPDRNQVTIAVTGKSDWSIVPTAFTAQFVFNGTDGDFYVRHLPLVGKISLTGRGISIQGKITADFNAELDSTFSGVLWAPVTITATINGSKTILFEGNASGTTVGLVSKGVLKLKGRGPFEGDKLELAFVEIGPGNTDTYNLNGTLIRGSRD